MTVRCVAETQFFETFERLLTLCRLCNVEVSGCGVAAVSGLHRQDLFFVLLSSASFCSDDESSDSFEVFLQWKRQRLRNGEARLAGMLA